MKITLLLGCWCCLTTLCSLTLAEDVGLKTSSLRGQVAVVESGESMIDPPRGRRDLLFLGRTTVCARRGSNTFYETRAVGRLWESFYRNRGAVLGRCSAVCKSRVCNHQPCADDYTIEDEICTCKKAPELSSCSTNAVCENDLCFCRKGYKGTPIANSAGCSDIDECSTKTSNCGANSLCTNTPGSFTCACVKGYEGDPTSPIGCTDINECAANAGICGPQGTCENTVGGRVCRCNAGYVWDAPDGICVDINECNTIGCGPNAVCTNVPGSFTCACQPGYASPTIPPSPTNQCVDVNECAGNPTVCGRNATCTNTVGSFTCACNTGFEGTAPSCVPDACTRTNQTCGDNARCNPTTPVCVCTGQGYERDTTKNTTFVCKDINECLNPSTCPPNQDCFNLPGTVQCGIKAFNPCPSGQTATCSPGLQCAPVSRSDNTLVCCSNVSPCTGTGGNNCCNDAYRLGETCPSQQDNDCEGTLDCGRTPGGDSTYRCCPRAGSIPGFSGRFCI